MKVSVRTEEIVYETCDWKNGAGTTWCFGSTCLIRQGDTVIASGNVLLDVASMNRIRWTLWQRRNGKWELLHRDQKDRTREPSPLILLGDRLQLSINPTVVEDVNDDSYHLAARPDVLTFNIHAPAEPPIALGLTWDGDPPFTEHSYRNFVCDPANDRFVLFNNVGYSHAEWTLYQANEWEAAGRLVWPWEENYDRPQSVRICYPAIQVNDRAVHFCGVSDVPEPYKKFKDAKQAARPRSLDFDFRRLFYTWTPDIANEDFGGWVEVSSRDATCGLLKPMDLCIRDDGGVHLIWTEQALDTDIRERFYPDEKQSWALMYALLRDGVVLKKHALRLKEEGSTGPEPRWGRFHIGADGRLIVIHHDRGDHPVTGILVLGEQGEIVDSAEIPLETHIDLSFNASHRCGNARGNIIDLLGSNPDHVARYACIELA